MTRATSCRIVRQTNCLPSGRVQTKWEALRMSLRIGSFSAIWTQGRKANLARNARRLRGRANHSGALHMPPASERVSWFMVSAFKVIGPLDSESRRLCLREACRSCFGISPLSSSSREHARSLPSERGINGRGPIAAVSQLGGHPFMPRKSEGSGLCSEKGRRAQRTTDAPRLTGDAARRAPLARSALINLWLFRRVGYRRSRKIDPERFWRVCGWLWAGESLSGESRSPRGGAGARTRGERSEPLDLK